MARNNQSQAKLQPNLSKKGFNNSEFNNKRRKNVDENG